MGLFITGTLLPHEITQEQWEQAYEEALQLVDAYDFLDIIYDAEKYAKYGEVWVYTEKSKERGRSVSVYGAYTGSVCAEGQFLYRDLSEYLCPDSKVGEADALCCHDALIGRLYDDEELEKYEDCQSNVFGNKTQGYPHHVPLLAIGLLLEARLGKAFTVYGDITRRQIKAAIEWANTVLDKPVSWPCAMDNAELLARIQAFVPRERQIETFLNLTYCAADEAMYQFFQEHFSEAELADYWKKEFDACISGTPGTSIFFSKYFGMTDNLKLLTKVCSAKYTPKEFANALAMSRVFELKKNADNRLNHRFHDSDRVMPGTLEDAMLGGYFLCNSAVERYIPLDQGVRDISLAYGDTGWPATDFEALISNAIKEAKPDNEMASEGLDILAEAAAAMQERAASVDISELGDLVLYKPTDRIDSVVETNLKNIREFVDLYKAETKRRYLEIYADEDLACKKLRRMAVVVKRCTALLPKSVWELFEQRIEDDSFFFTLLGLHTLKADTLPLAHYVKGLLYNHALFDRVLLS